MSVIEITEDEIEVDVEATEVTLEIQEEQELIVLEVSEPGSSGVDGVPGGVQRFIFDSPLTPWVVSHGLGLYPAVVTMDTLERVIEGEIEYNDFDTVTITFSQAVSGTAVIVY
jgi:sensor histidine kinase regulating citrate/malate metabolism